MQEIKSGKAYEIDENSIVLNSLNDSYKTINDFGRGISISNEKIEENSSSDNKLEIVKQFCGNDQKKVATVLSVHQGIYRDILDAFNCKVDLKIKGHDNELLQIKQVRGEISWAKDIAGQHYANIEMKMIYLDQKDENFFPKVYSLKAGELETLNDTQSRMAFEKIKPENGLIGILKGKIVISEDEKVYVESCRFTACADHVFESKKVVEEPIAEKSFFDSVISFFSSKEDKEQPARSVAEVYIRGF